VEEAATKRSWTYYLFWWRLDRVPYQVRVMLVNAEKGSAGFRSFIDEFQRRHDTLRRYFTEDLHALSEEERRRITEEAKHVIKQLDKAVALLVYADILTDKEPKSTFISALNDALRAEGVPPLPVGASTESIVRHLALMDPNVALRGLRNAVTNLETQIKTISEAAKEAYS